MLNFTRISKFTTTEVRRAFNVKLVSLYDRLNYQSTFLKYIGI